MLVSLVPLNLIAAFSLTALLLLLLRRPAVRVGLVDRPCQRKRHGRVVPLIGGLCILFGFLAVGIPSVGIERLEGLLIGMVILAATGVIDDLYDINPWSKLFSQILAALVMVGWSGLVVADLGMLFGPAFQVDLGGLAIPFTVLCVVGLINAINMFDGVDGLAGGTVAVALFWLSVAGLTAGAGTWPYLALLLLAAITGFLIFNMRNPWRRKAASFLGDSGSMMLGFALAWFAVKASHGAPPSLPPAALGWILALPVFDALVLMVRRILRGRHPFKPDREHLHHIFYRAGFTPGQAVPFLLLGSFLLGGLGVTLAWLGTPEWLLALLLLPVVVAHFALHFRAWRFATAMRRLLRVTRRRLQGQPKNRVL